MIFYFSHQPSNVSTHMSDGIIDKTIIKIYRTLPNYSSSNESVVKRVFTPIVRKSAHAIEYFILGILIINLLYVYNINNKIILLSLFVCFIYACSDEVHQLFIIGRSCQLIDILLDSLGGFLGIFSYKKVIIN